jgi:hypothetical protein
MEIWETLAQVHTARGFATRLALRRKFSRLVKNEEETMSAWFGRVKTLSFKLEDVGVVMTDEDRILALTNGLDDSYESFIISLDATPADQLTLEYVVDRLLNEEVRRGYSKKNATVTRGSAYITGARGMGSSRPGGTNGPHTCWRCGKQGHIQAYCRELPEGHGREVAHLAVGVSELRDLGVREVGHLI